MTCQNAPNQAKVNCGIKLEPGQNQNRNPTKVKVQKQTVEPLKTMPCLVSIQALVPGFQLAVSQGASGGPQGGGGPQGAGSQGLGLH